MHSQGIVVGNLKTHNFTLDANDNNINCSNQPTLRCTQYLCTIKESIKTIQEICPTIQFNELNNCSNSTARSDSLNCQFRSYNELSLALIMRHTL